MAVLKIEEVGRVKFTKTNGHYFVNSQLITRDALNVILNEVFPRANREAVRRGLETDGEIVVKINRSADSGANMPESKIYIDESNTGKAEPHVENAPQLKIPARVEYNGKPVLMLKQLAKLYGCAPDALRKIITNYRTQFIQGVHYFNLTGDKFKEFVNRKNIAHLLGNKASRVNLFTNSGASLFAEKLTFKEAKEAYLYIQKHYFDGETPSKQDEAVNERSRQDENCAN